ncbi:MAG: glycosyltransferase [Nitrospirota bacterium]|nr:glycosyltransferase [Nitrospirota bacterium]
MKLQSLKKIKELVNSNTKRVVFYSHDTFGLGNIRRTLSICQFLMESIPDLSILIISGSPMVHSFRIPEGVDYIKLPCLSRTESNGYGPKYLKENTQDIVKLRTELIVCALANFQPDLVIVDKKPYGVENELEPGLTYLKTYHPETIITLLLRDILDSPQATRAIWKKHEYFKALEAHYDRIFVLGSPEVFKACTEYQFPLSLKIKTQYCGYIRRESGQHTREHMRKRLGLTAEDQMVLVTAGGGEDGVRLFQQYLESMPKLSQRNRVYSTLIFGPEMSEAIRQELEIEASQWPSIKTLTFSDDVMSYLDAADVAVSMGGYGTICELLSLQKPALVIPRVRPVEEQWIRAQRMAELGLFQTIHPDQLTPGSLCEKLEDLLDQAINPKNLASKSIVNLDALPTLTMSILNLLMNGSWGHANSDTQVRYQQPERVHEAMLQLA